MINKTTSIMDADGIKRALNRISYEIIEKNNGVANIVIVGIKTRGIILAKRIAQKIYETEGIMPVVSTLDVSMYRDDLKAPPQKKVSGIDIMPENKDVIIVDDVLYTGRTVRAAIDAVLERGRAKTIQLAVLVDRGHRELPIRPDFIGKNLPTSKNEMVKVFVNEIDGKDAIEILK